MILDGFGINTEDNGNAVALAKTNVPNCAEFLSFTVVNSFAVAIASLFVEYAQTETL